MRPYNLKEHPEGGRYLEVFRSESKILTSDERKRSAITHIYFSLDPGEVSHFHKVKSDEIWNLYEGDQLRLYLWDEDSEQLNILELSRSEKDFCHVVPAGIWQAAQALDEKILVGCSVGPGFEFEDFELMTIDQKAAKVVIKKCPELKKLIKL